METVVDTLFPYVRESSELPELSLSSNTWSEELEVSKSELEQAVNRLSARNTAPGPDGIPGRVWVLTQDVLGNRLRQLFNGNGMFPAIWKEARLVLLKKEGRPEDSPSAYRPICLLDEVGKLFERIIATRLNIHLVREGPVYRKINLAFDGRVQRSMQSSA